MKWPEHDKWEKCASAVWKWARKKIIVRKGYAVIGGTCSAKLYEKTRANEREYLSLDISIAWLK